MKKLELILSVVAMALLMAWSPGAAAPGDVALTGNLERVWNQQPQTVAQFYQESGKKERHRCPVAEENRTDVEGTLVGSVELRENFYATARASRLFDAELNQFALGVSYRIWGSQPCDSKRATARTPRKPCK